MKPTKPLDRRTRVATRHQRQCSTNPAALALAGAWALAVVSSVASSVARAQPYDHSRLPLNILDAAGANGQPLLGTVDRANFGFLTFEDLSLRVGGHVEGSYSYNLDPFTRNPQLNQAGQL